MKNFYSIKEAAEYLEVDYKVVYRLVREGKIPSTRVGWQYRMTQEDLNTYLNAQRAVQMAQPTADAKERAMVRNGKPGRQGTGAAAVRENRVTKVKARQMEQNAVNRFNQKVRSIDTLRHPVSHKLMVIDDWETLYEKIEDREVLMHALNTAFLDRETLATTPRNTRVRYVIPETPDLILELRVLAHLAALCQAGVDDRPVHLEELMVVLQELEEAHGEEGATYILGLASPTGWSQEAIEYIQNAGRGDSYRHPHVRVLLLDLRTEALYYDELDPGTAGFASLFRLATEAEDVATLRAHLQAEVTEHHGVILADFARSAGVSEELALEAARYLAAQDPYRLIEDREAGWIIVAV